MGPASHVYRGRITVGFGEYGIFPNGRGEPGEEFLNIGAK